MHISKHCDFFSISQGSHHQLQSENIWQMAHIGKDVEYFTNDSSEVSHTNVFTPQKAHLISCNLWR